MRGASRAVLAAAVIAAVASCGQAVSSGHPETHQAGSPPPPAPRVTFPATDSNIHVALAFDYRTRNRSVGRNVDYIYGGYFPDWNFGFYPRGPHIDSYLPFDTDAYPQTIRDHSLRWWQTHHPDWVVYRCDRKTPAYYGSGNRNVPLDFTNPAVRRYQVDEAEKTFRMGAQGVAFDNFTFANAEDRCGVYHDGKWVSLGYPGPWKDNSTYDGDLLAWLKDMRTALARRNPDKSFGLNVNVFASGPQHLLEVVPYVDMVVDEGGFTNYGTVKLSGSLWQKEVGFLEYVNAHDKAFFVLGIVNAPSDADVSQDQINWVLANYLLVKGAHSYTYIYAGNHGGFTGSPTGYGSFYDRPQYHIPIGYPTSGREQVAGLEIRHFSRGLAIVNPSASDTHTLPLGAALHSMFGQTYDSVTLGPTSAIVLLNP